MRKKERMLWYMLLLILRHEHNQSIIFYDSNNFKEFDQNDIWSNVKFDFLSLLSPNSFVKKPPNNL